MAIYDEDEVFSLQPVANVTTNGLEQLEGPDFISHIVKTIDTSNLPEDYVLTIRELNEIYSHHCAYRILKKAAFLALPQILQAKLVLSSWKKKKAQDGSKSNDNRVSGLMGAPITIDNVKYLCLVGMRKNLKGIITPYTITLKDENGNIIGDKKVNSDIIVPDSNNGTSAFGSTHLSTDTASLDANSPSNANIDKNNKTDKNESKNMNRKNTIRLTESELKNIITESVENILKEGALDVISNVKSKDDKKKVGDLTRRVLNPQGINNAFNKIERVLDEISYLNDPRISIHYLENLRKKTQSLKQEFSMVTSNLGGSVANHFANPWSQDRRTFKYKPTNNLPFDDAEPEDWYERNEHGDFDEF